MAIIKVQAHIRGFLTRKMIYEHLEQLVYQNQLLYNQENNGEGFDGYGEEGEGDDGEDGDYDDEEEGKGDGNGQYFDENGNQIYQFQDAVQEVDTKEEETSDDDDNDGHAN